ncbi:30142_t:CDS:2, partial [Gigaspora margarita]
EKLEEVLCSNRSVSSGRKTAYSLAEKELSQWIVQLRQDKIAVILFAIKLKMKELLRTKFQHDYSNALDTFEASNIGTLTVDHHLAKTVQIKTISNKKNRFTYVLAILANGVKLLPLVIFIVKRLSRDHFPLDIVIKMQKNRMDSFEVHLMNSVKEKYNKLNTVRVYKKRNLKRAPYDLICQWMVEACNNILADIVVNSFKKYSISDGIKELEEQVIVLAKNIENLLIPIVYVKNSENLPRY